MGKFTLYSLLAAVFVFGSCKQEVQSQGMEDVEIKVFSLTDDLFMLAGQGGNIGVLITDDHILVVDSQFEPLHEKITSAIAELSDLPVKYLVNTHWHNDHVNGNAKFDQAGATVIAHENVKARLVSGGKVEFFGSEVPPQPRETQPDLTFSDEVELELGGQQISIVHVPEAHTDGDAFLHFEDQNAMHLGDIYFAKMYPFFDLGSGGTIGGLVAACEKALERCDENTLIIPGHGPLSNAKEFRAYTEMLKTVHREVRTAADKGLDLKTIVESSTSYMDGYQETFGGGFIDAKTLITFIYNSL